MHSGTRTVAFPLRVSSCALRHSYFTHFDWSASGLTKSRRTGASSRAASIASLHSAEPTWRCRSSPDAKQRQPCSFRRERNQYASSASSLAYEMKTSHFRSVEGDVLIHLSRGEANPRKDTRHVTP